MFLPRLLLAAITHCPFFVFEEAHNLKFKGYIHVWLLALAVPTLYPLVVAYIYISHSYPTHIYIYKLYIYIYCIIIHRFPWFSYKKAINGMALMVDSPHDMLYLILLSPSGRQACTFGLLGVQAMSGSPEWLEFGVLTICGDH